MWQNTVHNNIATQGYTVLICVVKARIHFCCHQRDNWLMYGLNPTTTWLHSIFGHIETSPQLQNFPPCSYHGNQAAKWPRFWPQSVLTLTHMRGFVHTPAWGPQAMALFEIVKRLILLWLSGHPYQTTLPVRVLMQLFQQYLTFPPAFMEREQGRETTYCEMWQWDIW